MGDRYRSDGGYVWLCHKVSSKREFGSLSRLFGFPSPNIKLGNKPFLALLSKCGTLHEFACHPCAYCWRIYSTSTLYIVVHCNFRLLKPKPQFTRLHWSVLLSKSAVIGCLACRLAAWSLEPSPTSLFHRQVR